MSQLLEIKKISHIKLINPSIFHPIILGFQQSHFILCLIKQIWYYYHTKSKLISYGDLIIMEKSNSIFPFCSSRSQNTCFIFICISNDKSRNKKFIFTNKWINIVRNLTQKEFFYVEYYNLGKCDAKTSWDKEVYS